MRSVPDIIIPSSLTEYFWFYADFSSAVDTFTALGGAVAVFIASTQLTATCCWQLISWRTEARLDDRYTPPHRPLSCFITNGLFHCLNIIVKSGNAGMCLRVNNCRDKLKLWM